MTFKYIILIVAVSILAACNTKEKNDIKNSDTIPKTIENMHLMKTFSIAKSNPIITLKLAGELKPDQQTELFAKVNSYVRQLKVDIGDKVVAGQTLAILEAPEIQSQIANAKAKVQAQEAIYVATKATYDRTLRANETPGAIAKDALDQIKARMLTDESLLKASRSAYNEIKNIQSYLLIQAPFDGTITDRSVDVGAYVGPMSKDPLLVIENSTKLRLHLSIPEASTTFVNLGDTIHFYVRSKQHKKYMAIVSRKSGSLDEKLRSERIQADFINKNKELKPYMIAESTLHLQNSEPTFFVPKLAIVESGIGVYVIRVVNGKTKNIMVTKGRSVDDKTEIFGDLNEGDIILKIATEEIQEGTNVPNSMLNSNK